MDRRKVLIIGGVLAGGGVGYYWRRGDDNGDTDPNDSQNQTDPGTTGNETDANDDSGGGGVSVNPPSGDVDFLDQYPKITDYSEHHVTVAIPHGGVPEAFTNGGDINVSLSEYDSPNTQSVGHISYDTLTHSTDRLNIDVELPSEVRSSGTPYHYTLDIVTPTESRREFLAETDQFTFTSGGLETKPHDVQVPPKNAEDTTALYRRDVGEGTYAIQLRGVTDETPWTFNFRIPKSQYITVAGRTDERDGPSIKRRIQDTFGPDAEEQFFLRELGRVVEEYGFSGAGLVRFAADLVRTLPEMPAVNSGFETPVNGVQQTFVEGGGDIRDITTVLAGFTYWVGYRTAVLFAQDHAAVGVVGQEFDGYSRGDNPQYYWLESTPIDGYVGVAPEEMQNIPTFSIPITEN